MLWAPAFAGVTMGGRVTMGLLDHVNLWYRFMTNGRCGDRGSVVMR